MSEQTKISWCDSTINFWEGCTKISAGCSNCYAEARDKRFTGGKLWGAGAPRRKSKSAVKAAIAMNRKPWICDQNGEAFSEDELPGYCMGFSEATFHRRRIFSLSLGDWLDDEVPIEWLAEMLDTIRQCDQVTWILCSKRPENFNRRMDLVLQFAKGHHMDGLRNFILCWADGEPEDGYKIPKNIILLTSVENQEQADKRIPQLLAIPAACRGLSLEPLLGEVNLMHVPTGSEKFKDGWALAVGLQWIIVGAESGSQRRECKLSWVRSLADQGKSSGVATFVKQIHDSEGLLVKDVSEFPKDLQIQEWPKGF